MQTRALIAIALLVAPLAGCIENMSDLRERISGSSTEVQPPMNETLKNATKNATKKVLPVARIDLFEKGGAKVFGSDFVAADAKIETTILGGKELSFVGSQSEALAPGAAIASHEWTFGDGASAKGSTVSHAYAETGGVFKVALKVTDSKGNVDTQRLELAVMPVLVVTNETLKGQIAAGFQGLNPGDQGLDRATHTFTIVAMGDDGRAYDHVGTLVRLSGGQTAVDVTMTITDAAGETLGSGTEIALEGLPAAEYTITVVLNAGAQADYSILVETSYQPQHPAVTAFFGGEGGEHGGH